MRTAEVAAVARTRWRWGACVGDRERRDNGDDGKKCGEEEEKRPVIYTPNLWYRIKSHPVCKGTFSSK